MSTSLLNFVTARRAITTLTRAGKNQVFGIQVRSYCVVDRTADAVKNNSHHGCPFRHKLTRKTKRKGLAIYAKCVEAWSQS
jgi:hypothetical protein